MGINLSRSFKGEGQKSTMNATRAATAFDRPTFKGFGYVLKSNSPKAPDRVARAFLTNSAFATRLQGTKIW